MPRIDEVVRLEGGIELRAKAGGGRVQPNPTWAAAWAERKTAPPVVAGGSAMPAAVEPEPAQRFLAEKILAACAGHLWCSVPQLQFVKRFPGNPDGRAKYAGGVVYIRVDQHGEDLVEAAAHELAHHYVAKVATRGDAWAAENAEEYARGYGQLVQRAWKYNAQHGAGLDFGYVLSREPRREPVGV